VLVVVVKVLIKVVVVPRSSRFSAVPGHVPGATGGICSTARALSYAYGVHTREIEQPLDDAAIARAIAAAAPRVDKKAEAELYRRLAPRVRLYGLRHLRNAHAADDLMQQVLLMTLERVRAGKLRQPEKLASFVLGMCRMVVLEARRGTARREELLHIYGDSSSEPMDHAEQPDVDEAKLSGCLGRLAERERSVLVMGFFADKSADAVGLELGLTPANVRVIRHRALLKLRECMNISDST
jgi:RNA polymerase sigma-70 factor (ECF subfamily)